MTAYSDPTSHITWSASTGDRTTDEHRGPAHRISGPGWFPEGDVIPCVITP
ncbi:hypothetical protein ACFQ1S_13290 [Kibdelosporangium lantanae]|uniref:Uncharacterized protein n=1 Tax=Kibdelosporangium lantanae TaxID=1497396 RepID=A0ABW3M798_9PSEU